MKSVQFFCDNYDNSECLTERGPKVSRHAYTQDYLDFNPNIPLNAIGNSNENGEENVSVLNRSENGARFRCPNLSNAYTQECLGNLNLNIPHNVIYECSENGKEISSELNSLGYVASFPERFPNPSHDASTKGCPEDLNLNFPLSVLHESCENGEEISSELNSLGNGTNLPEPCPNPSNDAYTQGCPEDLNLNFPLSVIYECSENTDEISSELNSLANVASFPERFPNPSNDAYTQGCPENLNLNFPLSVIHETSENGEEISSELNSLRNGASFPERYPNPSNDLHTQGCPEDLNLNFPRSIIHESSENGEEISSELNSLRNGASFPERYPNTSNDAYTQGCREKFNLNFPLSVIYESSESSEEIRSELNSLGYGASFPEPSQNPSNDAYTQDCPEDLNLNFPVNLISESIENGEEISSELNSSGNGASFPERSPNPSNHAYTQEDLNLNFPLNIKSGSSESGEEINSVLNSLGNDSSCNSYEGNPDLKCGDDCNISNSDRTKLNINLTLTIDEESGNDESGSEDSSTSSESISTESVENLATTEICFADDYKSWYIDTDCDARCHCLNEDCLVHNSCPYQDAPYWPKEMKCLCLEDQETD